MSTFIRVGLLIGALFMFLFVLRGVRKSRFKAQETFFWLVISLVFVVLSIFPQIAGWFAGIMGVISSVNLVYLVVIFLLLVKAFTTDRKAAKLEHQLTQLVQRIAITETTKAEPEGDGSDDGVQ